MAIDGTKIIDSDLAHDVYNEFNELYDNGLEIEGIRQKIDLWRDQGLEQVEFEIFITAYAFALWETGHLDDELRAEVIQTVEKGAGVKMWLDERGVKDSRARERVLSRFLEKIGISKAIPRKRRPTKIPAKFLFAPDDVVSFQMPDGSFRAAIIIGIEQIRRQTVYQFAPTSFDGAKPTTNGTVDGLSVFMDKIGSGFPRDQVRKQQPGIEKFWKTDKQFSIPFTLGLFTVWITHRDLIKFADNFGLVGRAKIKAGFKAIGSFGYCSTFADLTERLEDLTEQVKIWKREIVPLSAIMDRPTSSKLRIFTF